MEGVTSAESVLDIINTKNANSLDITKEDTLTYDLGNLTSFDYAPINVKELRYRITWYFNLSSTDKIQKVICVQLSEKIHNCFSKKYINSKSSVHLQMLMAH